MSVYGDERTVIPLTREVLADIHRRWPAKLREIRLQHGQTPVAIGGNRRRGARLGYFEEPLRDGTRGFYMRRADDCLQAAVASVLQAPPHTVPDLKIDDKLFAGHDPEELARWVWTKMVDWADRRGLTIMIHPTPPLSERRWIGVIAEPGSFNDHCVLMAGRDRLFDPSNRPEEPDQYSGAEIAYGIVIRKE